MCCGSSGKTSLSSSSRVSGAAAPYRYRLLSSSGLLLDSEALIFSSLVLKSYSEACIIFLPPIQCITVALMYLETRGATSPFSLACLPASRSNYRTFLTMCLQRPDNHAYSKPNAPGLELSDVGLLGQPFAGSALISSFRCIHHERPLNSANAGMKIPAPAAIVPTPAHTKSRD